MEDLKLAGPESWDEAIRTTDGPQLVVGGPGSGKTEFLVRRGLHLINESDVPPENMLLLSFSRRGAADLRRRVGASVGRSVSRIPASTFHSLAMRIIEAHGATGGWSTVPTLLTGPEQVALVADVLEEQDRATWPLIFRDLLTDPAFADEVADFVLRASERLAGPTEIDRAGRADWRAIPGFMRSYRAALVERGRIDYGSLQVEAVRLLEDPGVRAALASQIRYVLVDEYQDTTVAQARIVQRIAPDGNVTVAGDPYQSIYSFRGAELSNIADFPELFTDDSGSPARRIVLTTSLRVPENILQAAVRVTAGAGLPGSAGPMQPAGPGGSVETYAFDQHSHEAEWIAGEIQRIHLRDRIPYSRIAVLVRSKRRFLPELSRALDRRRIPHDRPDARLVDHPAVRPVLDLVRAVAGTGSTARAAVRRVLLGPMGGLTLSATRELERRSPDLAAVASDPTIPASLAELLSDSTWASEVPAAEGFWRVWNVADVFLDMVSDEDRAEDRRAVASFAQALNRLAERDPSASLADYAEMTETEDFEATPLLEFRGDDDRLALTTLHQSKGMTFDVVFIADAREGVLPDVRTRDSLLGARHLSPSHGGDDTAYAAFRLQEEMRLVYSAICRASVRVVVTCTTTGFDAGEGMPSRFLPMIAGTSMEEATRPPSPWTDPTTPLEAEAWLRRTVAEPEAALVDRLAALHSLVADSSWRPRHPAEFAGVLPRGPDTGLIEHNPILSASQADSYSTCPRRYAFERRLGIHQGGSVHQELGSAIHTALEQAESAAADRGDSHASADEAVAAFDDAFEPEVFGGGAWAAAWRDRAAAIITRLYELWPGEGPGVAFETGFEIEVAGARWRGRIDRVERRGDAVHVVDYKTGTTVPTIPNAAVSLQLGLYVLGLGARSKEPVSGADFWFPAAGMKTRKTVTVRSLDRDRLDEVEDGLRAAASGIIGERWEAVTGAHCERCPVRTVCPEWPEGQEAFLS